MLKILFREENLLKEIEQARKNVEKKIANERWLAMQQAEREKAEEAKDRVKKMVLFQNNSFRLIIKSILFRQFVFCFRRPTAASTFFFLLNNRVLGHEIVSAGQMRF